MLVALFFHDMFSASVNNEKEYTKTRLANEGKKTYNGREQYDIRREKEKLKEIYCRHTVIQMLLDRNCTKKIMYKAYYPNIIMKERKKIHQKSNH